MNQQEIERIIQEPNFQAIIDENDFYFLKGQEVLNRWLNLEVSEQMKEDLIRISSDYTQFLEIAEINPEVENIKKLIFEIISYCDISAKDKEAYNQYADNRILARAGVFMQHWIDGIIKFKFEHAKITAMSVSNALNYLKSPQDNCTILSEDHRKQVSKNLLKKDFSRANFITDLKDYFSQYNLQVNNKDNYTYLLSEIIYNFRDEWNEEIMGLMASDGTGWQESQINLEAHYKGLLIWNSRKPSGGKETLKSLRTKLKDNGSFPLYYSSKGFINYKANIVDFVISQKELSEKNWDSESIKHYFPKFEDYSDTNKKAYIVFLAESIDKISSKPISDFEFYKNYKRPTQDNLSPIKKISNEELLEKPNSNMSINNSSTNIPLNQILFGPPGTGKTYNTINKALEIINDNEVQQLDWNNRQAVKTLFDKKMKEGQIVFTTFHQSMSYEEFIEGIKPVVPDKSNDDSEDDQTDKSLSYDVLPGIFRRIVKDATEKISQQYNFESIWKDYAKYLKSLGEEKIFRSIQSEMKFESLESNDNTILVRYKKSFDPSKEEGIRTFIVTKNALEKLWNEKIVGSDENKKGRKEVAEIHGSGRATHIFAVYKDFYEFALQEGALKKEVKEKNYVLIIDEINRGNVSQIFGELITLIEEDKRLGKDEALEVTLPYSKEKFGVPPNLYIIGTMNTADRSVEALDTALRRRFDFTEMPPVAELLEPSLVLQRLWVKFAELDWDDPKWKKIEDDFFELHGASVLKRDAYEDLESENDLNILSERFNEVIDFKGLNLKNLLTLINNRIEKLLDRDHLIGHSYFFNVYSWEDLKESFYQNIIPLMQEYFYGDYAKIGAVLGNGFVFKNEEDSVIFGDGFNEEEYSDKDIYQIIDYRIDGNPLIPANMSFEEAIQKLMNKPKEIAIEPEA